MMLLKDLLLMDCCTVISTLVGWNSERKICLIMIQSEVLWV